MTMPKSYYGDSGRIAEAHRLEGTAAPYWFKREGFNPSGNYSGRPQWHAFKQRRDHPSKPGGFVWEAACGYSYKCNEVISLPPTLRDTPVKSPKIRCAKCTAIIEKRKK